PTLIAGLQVHASDLVSRILVPDYGLVPNKLAGVVFGVCLVLNDNGSIPIHPKQYVNIVYLPVNLDGTVLRRLGRAADFEEAVKEGGRRCVEGFVLRPERRVGPGC